MSRIPLFRPVVCEEAITAVAEVLRSGWLGLGPRTAAFEKAFAGFVAAPQCVALNSATSALHLALTLLDIPRESEIITPAMTFVATNLVVKYMGCRPVFADIQPRTGNLDVRSVAARITDRTKAIILVHFGGYPCDLDEFLALSQETGIPLVEDCAHACGATYRGRPIGSHDTLQAFSFQALKNLPIGDGGALTFRTPTLLERAKRLRCFGQTADAFARVSNSGFQWDYEVPELGFKYYMNDIQGALALAQLPHVPAQNARRAALHARYQQGLAGTPGIELLHYATDRDSSHLLMTVLADERDGLIEKLRIAGITAGVHFRRNDDFPIFERAELPATESFSQRAVSLPMHLALTEDHVDYIVQQIRSGWGRARRAA